MEPTIGPNQPNPDSVASQSHLSRVEFIALWSVFAAYLLFRLATWKNTVLLEDHDSVSYLRQIAVFRSFNLQGIESLGPDTMPFYPFFGALFSLPGWSVETGARLCSLVSSAVLFWAIFGVGRRLGRFAEYFPGLILLTFSAPLVFLSVSVLTEPSYIALVYVGLALFIVRHRVPTVASAGSIGVLFGASFLARTEGLVYLAAIPLLQAASWALVGRRSYSWRRLLTWVAVFVISYSALAAPQIGWVSGKLGRFAVNGRQVWAAILNTPDGKSYDAKIYGLDYSPSEINLSYIQKHPEVQRELAAAVTLKGVLRKVVANTEYLYEQQLGVLMGPLAIAFFVIGVLALIASQRHVEIVLLIAFICVSLVGPLAHNVVMRHISIVAPAMLLTAGIGVSDTARKLSSLSTSRLATAPTLTLLLVLLVVVGDLPSLRSNLSAGSLDRWSNTSYVPADLSEPARILTQAAQKELERPPRVAARKGYLAYIAQTESVSLPYTDYQGLVEFCVMNRVDFLFLEHFHVEGYPFLKSFTGNSAGSDFTRLYAAYDSRGRMLELYRFGQGER